MDGSERLGVLHLHLKDGVTLPGSVVPDGKARVADAWALASMAGLLLVSKRTNSDSYARLARSRAMRVSAEMQWTLMPPMAFANEHVTISAAMEPAYHVAGDGFDYAVTGDVACPSRSATTSWNPATGSCCTPAASPKPATAAAAGCYEPAVCSLHVLSTGHPEEGSATR